MVILLLDNVAKSWWGGSCPSYYLPGLFEPIATASDLEAAKRSPGGQARVGKSIPAS
jgi:hypothetical protein